MKTLSEAVQLQIIEQAGTTYRSVVLAQLKDGVTRQDCVTDSFRVTQFFIDMMIKNMSSNGVDIETPPIIDFLNITGDTLGS